MIQFENVSFSFPDKPILQNAKFSLKPGERVALLGPSGAGKTTFLRLCAGLLTPQKGTIRRNGQIAVQFQEPRLLPWLTVQENILLVNPSAAGDLVTELLRAVGMENEKDALPENLSGGMKQRVSLARTLAYGGEIFLLDEPLNALDPELKERVISVLNEKTAGASLLIVTHDPQEADRLHCRKVYWDAFQSEL